MIKTMLKSKRGQLYIFKAMFNIMIFVILLAFGFASFFNFFGLFAINTHNLTGIEGFFWNNLNIWIGLGSVLGAMAYLYYGGNT